MKDNCRYNVTSEVGWAVPSNKSSYMRVKMAKNCTCITNGPLFIAYIPK